MGEKIQPKVTIATRTVDRPEFLARARETLLGQSEQAFEWIIVNDGGQRQPAEDCAETARRAGLDVTVIHNDVACGRGAAANQAVRAGQAPYIVLHDDDDALHPEYIEDTTRFLDQKPHYGGVITQVFKVTETVDQRETGRVILEPYTQPVRLIDMAERNVFPPISFVYRRDIFEKTEGYDEAVPVLEDWVFNLRFMESADIGVIAKPLADYFWRTDQDGTHPAANTVVAGRGEHFEYDVLIRNRFLREDMSHNKIGLGFLVNPPHRLAADRINQGVLSLNKLRKPGASVRNWWRSKRQS